MPIILDANGIEAVGTGRRIDFGRDRAGVVQTMTRLRGEAPDHLACTEPNITAVTWDDGLALVFRSSAFTGWGTRSPSLSYDGRSTFGAVCIGIG